MYYLKRFLLSLFFTCFFASTHSSHPLVQINKTDMDTLSCLSYNVWALPVWVPRAGFKRRFKPMLDKIIKEDYDIICLQECFAKRFREKAIKRLNRYHSLNNYKCTQIAVGPIKVDCFGGLMTFSKYPILDQWFYTYPLNDSMRIEEKIGRKGFLISKILRNSDTLLIINTHLYSGGKPKDENQRFNQIRHMAKVLEENRQANAYPILLMGDFNIEHPQISRERLKQFSKVYQFIQKKMGFMDSAPNLETDYYTIDKSRNNYAKQTNGKQKLDYLWYRSSRFGSVKIVFQNACFAIREAYSDHLAWRTDVAITAHNNVLVQNRPF